MVQKIKEDQQHFATSDSFKEYFSNKDSTNKAFTRYFYYFHFNKLTSESSDGINDEVIQDYTDFEKSKDEYKDSLTKYAWLNIVSAIIFVVVIFFMIKKLVVVWDDALAIIPVLKRSSEGQNHFINRIDLDENRQLQSFFQQQ